MSSPAAPEASSTRDERRADGRTVVRRALRLLRPYWLRQIELFGYMVGDLLVSLAIPLSTKYLFDDIIAPRDFARLAVWLVVVPALFVAGSFAGYRRVVAGALIGELVLRDFQRAAFAQLQRLSLAFYNRSRAGDLLARMTNDMEKVQDTVGETLPALLFQLISLIVGGVVVLLLNWILGLFVLLLGAPVFAAVYTRVRDDLSRASRDLQDRTGSLTAFLQENTSLQRLVKSFSLEKRAIASFEQLQGEIFQAGLRLSRIGAVLSGSTGMVFLGIRVVVLGLGAVLIMNGMMSVGDLVAFITLLAQVLLPVTSIARYYRDLQSARGAFDRIEELMTEVPDVVEYPLATELPGLEREIRLEHVSFRYADGEAGLHDVSIAIPAGSRVAVVGPSGGGKSTLVDLLLRLYDPTEGRVLFDGRDIRTATLASLRRQFAVVPQETFLFNASIAENIALGREGASEAEVIRAARAAALHEVAEKSEHGYQTVIGERGVRLSGGQRQRLAIARALIRAPKVLVLDEATSALDAETEASILRTLEEVGRGRTMVMVTHRLALAVHCDAIFVLDQGRLVEHGTHQELCGRQGLYWRLFSEQQAGLEAPLVVPIEPRRLARIPLFASLGPAELAAVAARLSVEWYDAGTVLMRQGETADRLFAIGAGEVEVMAEDRFGEPRRVKVLGVRSYFGEIALLGDDARRTATVRALTPVQLYGLHKEDFLAMLRAQPRLTEAVSRLARMRAQQTEEITGAAAEPRPAADVAGSSPSRA